MPRVTTNPDSYAEVCEKKFLALYEKVENVACYEFHLEGDEARKLKRLCRVMYTTGLADGVKLVYDSLPPTPKPKSSLWVYAILMCVWVLSLVVLVLF